ncbi:M3 family metallopeptidase [Mycoplasma parvum]|uniref:Oligoendopeptidase F n=1 Tax=Mycoplasma parvum str. Indiana TaxID=1403316 RepID=U5NBD2_9MOLU|nr:M3 family metallopeptidase [Mycoplasma parvum]AGX88846.1 oligoendopeptidase F [Mycoplasma parvum str. Indiana]
MNKKEMKNNWNLEILLENKSLEEWLKNYFEMQQNILELYKGGIFQDLEKLIKFHHLEREYDILSNRIKTYINNHQNTDQFNNKWFALEQELLHKSIPFAQQLTDFMEKAIKNKKIILTYLEDPRFFCFKRYYENIFRYQKHRLAPKLAKFELTFAPLSSSYYEVFNILSEKEFKLTGVLDQKGEEKTISVYPEYIKYMREEDRVLRKNLYHKYTEFSFSRRDSFSRLLYYHFLSANIESKNISFKKGFVDSAIYSDEISRKFLSILYKNTKKIQSEVFKFRELRKKIIMKVYNLPDFQDWDSYLELKDEGESKKYSIEEAKQIVLDSLSVLGDKYIEFLKTIFKNQWIDWLPRNGKNSGAYFSGGSYKLPGKFILLNYNEYFDDVLTLAHELGHAIHEMQIDTKDTFYYSPTIFTAEIPSILNELLMNYYFLKIFKKEGNKFKMLQIYDHLLNTFVSTAVIQLIYSEWEFLINEKIANNQSIDSEVEMDSYSELINLYTGKKITKNIEDLSWQSLSKIFLIPHFYSGEFYLYKYAVGLFTSLIFSKKILEGDENSREKSKKDYFDFLASGNSLSNLDSLKLLSISLESQESWKIISETFKTWLKEYSELAKELYGIS